MNLLVGFSVSHWACGRIDQDLVFGTRPETPRKSIVVVFPLFPAVLHAGGAITPPRGPSYTLYRLYLPIAFNEVLYYALNLFGGARI